MIQGPQYSHNMNRICPIDPDRQEHDGRQGKKKKQYQGRTWEAEAEDDLPLQPTMPQNLPVRRSQTGAYADKRAQALFALLTTIEEKAAQLCFLVTEAVYDSQLQLEVELLIQSWQIGGILFHKGEYRRQAYLIERYQEISKTPLLIANDFLHGLSFYLQGGTLSKETLSEQRCCDLGKAVTVQNRSLGVHAQFARERGETSESMTDTQAKAFRKGIRGAHGIVAKEKSPLALENPTPAVKGSFPLPGSQKGSALSEFQVQESIGFKTLSVFDASRLEKEALEEELHKAFKELYDVFLFSGNITEAIRAIARLVRSGKISESTLDRHVLKALIIKSLFFK